MTKTIAAPEIDLGKLGPILDEFREEKGALIPLLQKVQDEYGYIPEETIEPIAEAMGLFASQVYGVITFYAQFYTTPRGRNLVRVCRGTACHVRGGKKLLQIVQRELEIEDGETTEDYQFSLETVACLGACALSPVMVVNQIYYGKMNPKKVATVLGQYTSE